MQTITLWVSLEEYEKYKTGEVVIAWNKSHEKTSIQLNIPLKDIIGHNDWGREGIEFNFKKDL